MTLYDMMMLMAERDVKEVGHKRTLRHKRYPTKPVIIAALSSSVANKVMMMMMMVMMMVMMIFPNLMLL